MWHFLYIVAFAVLAFLAVSNLVRNLIMLGSDARRQSSQASGSSHPELESRPVPHPELLDDQGNVIREPLLVMRSISMKDAREQLDALYNGPSNAADDPTEDERSD